MANGRTNRKVRIEATKGLMALHAIDLLNKYFNLY